MHSTFIVALPIHNSKIIILRVQHSDCHGMEMKQRQSGKQPTWSKKAPQDDVVLDPHPHHQNFHLYSFRCQTPHTRQTHTTYPSSSASSSSPFSPLSSDLSSIHLLLCYPTLANYCLGLAIPPHHFHLQSRRKQQQCPGHKNNSPFLQRAEAVTSSPTRSSKKCQRSRITKSAFCSYLCNTRVAH